MGEAEQGRQEEAGRNPDFPYATAGDSVQLPSPAPAALSYPHAYPDQAGRYPIVLPPKPPPAAWELPPYGRVTLTPQDSLAHIHWLAGAGWPAEAIAVDLALRRLPTLGKDLPFVKQAWRPYMVRSILRGLAPSATLAMGAGLISVLLNPFMLVSIAAILLFVQTRREVRDSGGRLRGMGRAALGLGVGILGMLMFIAFLALQIVMALDGQG